VQLGNTLLRVLRHARRAQPGNTHFQERQHARPARSALLMRCHSKATFLIVWHAQSVIMLLQESLRRVLSAEAESLPQRGLQHASAVSLV
jgi:hypothetical protein